MTPLNGTRTHPLSPIALATLREIAHAPAPQQSINPGLNNRLLREALVEVVQLPSPFKTHRGRPIPFLRITEAGSSAIAEKSS